MSKTKTSLRQRYAALVNSLGGPSEAADAIGVSRRAIHYKLKRGKDGREVFLRDVLALERALQLQGEDA